MVQIRVTLDCRETRECREGRLKKLVRVRLHRRTSLDVHLASDRKTAFALKRAPPFFNGTTLDPRAVVPVFQHKPFTYEEVPNHVQVLRDQLPWIFIQSGAILQFQFSKERSSHLKLDAPDDGSAQSLVDTRGRPPLAKRIAVFGHESSGHFRCLINGEIDAANKLGPRLRQVVNTECVHGFLHVRRCRETTSVRDLSGLKIPKELTKPAFQFLHSALWFEREYPSASKIRLYVPFPASVHQIPQLDQLGVSCSRNFACPHSYAVADDVEVVHGSL